MLHRKLNLNAARRRLIWRMALTLIAALVLASGAVVGRRAGKAAPSSRTPGLAPLTTTSLADAVPPGLG